MEHINKLFYNTKSITHKPRHADRHSLIILFALGIAAWIPVLVIALFFFG